MTQIMLRVPDEDAVKIRIIAAAHKTSMNGFIKTLIRREIQNWESQYGVIPILFPEENLS